MKSHANSPLIHAWRLRYDIGIPHALSNRELLFAEGIADQAARGKYVATRSAVRHVLGHVTGISLNKLDIRISQSGKPRLENSELDFSLSHSEDHLVIAVAAFAIGIDFQARAPSHSVLELGRRFFSLADAQVLEAAPEERRVKLFLQQWVAKEAALKVHGWGIAGSLERSQCLWTEGGVSRVDVGSASFRIIEFAIGENPGAIAHELDGDPVVEWSESLP